MDFVLFFGAQYKSNIFKKFIVYCTIDSSAFKKTNTHCWFLILTHPITIINTAPNSFTPI